jgi:hypothetical protein
MLHAPVGRASPAQRQAINNPAPRRAAGSPSVDVRRAVAAVDTSLAWRRLSMFARLGPLSRGTVMHATMRPLSFGEILDGAFTLLRRNFSALFAIALLPQIPVILFWLIAPALIDPVSEGDVFLSAAPLLLSPYSMFASLLIMGALTHAAAVAYAGERPGMSSSLGRGLRRFLPLLAVTVLAWLAMAVGLLLFVIPGLIVIAMYFAVYAAVVIEGRGPLDALGRSRRLSKGGRMRILGVIIVAVLITWLPLMALWMFAGVSIGIGATLNAAAVSGTSVWLTSLMQACAIVIGSVTMPFLMIVTVLLYYDRRARTEAPDLESAVAALGHAV